MLRRHRPKPRLRDARPALAPALFALAAACAHAQPAHDPQPDQSSRRVVRSFDFEEPSNPDDVPLGWVRAQSPRADTTTDPSEIRAGFPEFNRAGFDFNTARSGGASVRLPSSGGSVSLRLQAGEIAIFPDADYLVRAHCRTEGARFSRAFLVARLLDQHLDPIPESETRSQPVFSPDGWAAVSVTLPGRFPEAAWLQVDLELLQPSQFMPPTQGVLARHTIQREDIRASAWFDDVAVMQVPRGRLWTEAPDNIIAPPHDAGDDQPPEPPVLWMSARDLSTGELTAYVTIADAHGSLVASGTHTLDPGGRPTSWQPRLPLFGWYRASMTLLNNNTPVSSASIDLAYLAPARRGAVASPDREPDLRRLGLIAEDLPESMLPKLPGLINVLSTGFVMLPMFDASAPPEDQADALNAREPVYSALLDQSQTITLTLPRVPPALASSLSLDGADAVGMASRAASLWEPYLTPTLDIFGQRLLRYQLGPVGDPHVLRRELSPPLTSFERILARLVPTPSIAVSWWADHAPPVVSRLDAPGPPGHIHADEPLLDAITLVVPASFPAGSIPGIAAEWSSRSLEPGRPAPEVTLVPELPDLDRFGAEARMTELSKRVVEFWTSLGPTMVSQARGVPVSTPRPAPPAAPQTVRLGIRSPWRIGTDTAGLDPDAPRQLFPAPEMVAMRTLADRLAGRRVVSRLAAPNGVRALVLAAEAAPGATGRDAALERGCVIAWNESADPADARVEFAAATPAVSIVDISGNTRTIDARAQQSAEAPTNTVPIVSVNVGPAPVFIEGVDPYLAMFAAGFRIDPSYLRAESTEHDQRITLINPWPVRISGKLQIKPNADDPASARRGPDDWNVSPQGVIDFTIDPGESITIPITVNFSARQLAGVRDFSVIARVQADRAYPPIRLQAPVEVGLPELDFTPELALGPDPTGPDVLVNVTVNNKDTRPRSLVLEAAVRGHPTQQTQISDLAPGESTLRRFAFRGGAAELTGRRILISLSDAEAPERLNKAVQVP